MKLANKALVGVGLTLAVMAIGCGGKVTEPGGGGSSGAGGTAGATGAGGSSGAGGTAGATGAGGSSGVVEDDGGPCSSKHSASCVCVCADSSGDSGCVNEVCPFSEAYCFGPSAGCPPGQVCSVYGDICTPVCGNDGTCPEGMKALHLLP